jgi:hypothetical protein
MTKKYPVPAPACDSDDNSNYQCYWEADNHSWNENKAVCYTGMKDNA